jgi:hypothetical protein
MEPKFKPGDRVVFLYGKMEPHHGTVEKYHGTAFDKKDIYSVTDDTSLYEGVPTRRFLYSYEMTLDTEAHA